MIDETKGTMVSQLKRKNRTRSSMRRRRRGGGGEEERGREAEREAARERERERKEKRKKDGEDATLTGRVQQMQYIIIRDHSLNEKRDIFRSACFVAYTRCGLHRMC